MPRHYGLFGGGFIVREHNNPICLRIMDEWFKCYMMGFKRDQLVFSYVLYKNNIKREDLGILGINMRDNGTIILHRHK